MSHIDYNHVVLTIRGLQLGDENLALVMWEGLVDLIIVLNPEAASGVVLNNLHIPLLEPFHKNTAFA